MFEKPVHKNGGLFDPVGFWDRPYILKASPATPTGPQKNLNIPQICPKMPRNGPKMTQNWPKMTQNGPKMTSTFSAIFLTGKVVPQTF